MESRTQGSRPRTQKKSKAKDDLSEDRHSRGQGQECSRPRTQAQVLSKKKKGLHKNFCDLQKKKGLTKIFQAISTKKRFPKNFSSAPQNFNNSKNTAVLEPRTGQFSRTWGLEAKDFKICPWGLHLWSSEQRKRILDHYHYGYAYPWYHTSTSDSSKRKKGRHFSGIFELNFYEVRRFYLAPKTGVFISRKTVDTRQLQQWRI